MLDPDITSQGRSLVDDQPAAMEARLALAIAAGRMAVWDYDVASDRVTGSPKLNRLFGFLPGIEPTTEEIRACYCPGERERIQAEGRAAMARGERFVESEIRHRWPDGSIHWALLRAEAVHDASGRPARALGVVMDITERKRNEEAFRASEARLNLAKSVAGFGVWDWHRSTNLITWSSERAKPDLMILDFAMPVMNGAEVARAARLRHPDLKIVFGSGYADTDQILQAVGPKIMLLRKPFSMGDLANALSSALLAAPVILPH